MSHACIGEAFRPIEEKYRNIVHCITWGHLFPESGSVIKGSIRIAECAYGQVVILEENIEIENSPWWYESITDFSYKFLKQNNKPGTVFEVDIQAAVVKVPGKDAEQIEIREIKHIIVLDISADSQKNSKPGS